MKKLEKLTKEQLAELPKFRDEFIAHGLAAQPADRAAAEEHVKAAYTVAGKQPPKIIIWLQSPMSGSIGAAMLVSVGDQVGDQVRTQVYSASYGQHDAGWLAYYAAFSAFGVVAADKLLPAIGLAKTCGWWWPFENLVILTERPVVLRRNSRNQLHCETGPALQYPDGWGIFVVNGVRVTEQIVMSPATLTKEQITAETNSEVKRVMIERIGYAKYLEMTNAVLVHQDNDPNTGSPRKLWEFASPELLVVQVLNSTPEPDGSIRSYFLSVHPECRPLLGDTQDDLGPAQALTCGAAVASTFGMTEQEYNGVSVQT